MGKINRTKNGPDYHYPQVKQYPWVTYDKQRIPTGNPQIQPTIGRQVVGI